MIKRFLGLRFHRTAQFWFALCLLASAQGLAQADPEKPIFLSESTSTRAIALDALILTPEPFSPSASSFLYGLDRRPRIMLFVRNLSIQSAGDISAMSADAEDVSRRHYGLNVEDVRPVPGQIWMSQIILRFNEEIGDVGDVLIGMAYRGIASNRVRIGIGHIGGGLPDDVGALPTPAPPYTITGRITYGTTGLGGTLVTLGGPQAGVTTTDDNGAYSFTVTPVGNYTITPSKAFYTLSPSSKILNDLSGNRTVDFTAIRTIRISGHITDSNGRGIIGITLDLSGSEQGKVITGSDGSYSFIPTTVGDYLLTPSKEQNFYTFTPSTKRFSGLNDNQIANFTGLLSSSSNPSYVLEFDGSPMTVDYRDFWPVNVGLPHFFWELWAMPGENTYTRYLLSDGYGGAHALLFGFNYNVEPGRYNLFGNIWDGSTWTQFVSDDGPSPGEWGHYAVGWDGMNIITYYNGVPVGKQPFAGPRICMGLGWGASMLLIGGSDHQNLIGRIAQVRGYEGSNPREGAPETSFAPQTVFSRDGQLLSYFFRSAQTVADLSFGYNSVTHLGKLRGFSNGYTVDCPDCPTPRFVLDPTAPEFSNPSNPGTIIAPFSPAPATPSSALIYDSFSSNNSTYILGGSGGLGATEGGAAGTQTWQTNADASGPQPFGILSGRAILLANDTSLAWVPTGSSTGNLDIRVDRRLGSYGNGVNTGLCFRVIDKNNFFFAYTSDGTDLPSTSKKLSVGYYRSGSQILLASDITISSPNWKTLRVVTLQSGSINIYADNVLLYSTNSVVLAAAAGAGLYNNGPRLGLTNRWDNFTVLPAL